MEGGQDQVNTVLSESKILLKGPAILRVRLKITRSGAGDSSSGAGVTFSRVSVTTKKAGNTSRKAGDTACAVNK